MKRISKSWMIVFLTGLNLATEAKQMELLFDHALQQELSLTTENLVDQKTPIIFENKGNEILNNILPTTQFHHPYTIESISTRIMQADQPLQALFKLWSEGVKITETSLEPIYDPFYILNFKGSCSKEHYITSFIKLCSLIGIDVRPVTIQGAECYDFCYEGNHWQYMNPLSGQMYLDWDNRTFISSEEVMDDPFLALRTKHSQIHTDFDFKDACLQLAQIKIINAHLPNEIASNPSCEERYHIAGFDLYPGEKLLYHFSNHNPCAHACMEHILKIKNREGHPFIYTSSFPIKHLFNDTEGTLFIGDRSILAGNSLEIKNDNTFQLEIISEGSHSSGRIHIWTLCSEKLIPILEKGNNQIDLGIPVNNTSIQMLCTLENNAREAQVKVTNLSPVFDHCSPCFHVETSTTAEPDQIWWQISSDRSFATIPSNFEQIQPFHSLVTLPLITETFFNPNQTYFFRAKILVNGHWNEWSESFSFISYKPETVSNIEFNKLEKNSFEISWEPSSANSEYLIFGSNSLDFIPSIYSSTQINAMVDGEVVEAESNQNLLFTTKANRVTVDGSLAYYRIITKQNNHYSVPSKLIHVYDEELIQTRDILQAKPDETEHAIVQRTVIPLTYSESSTPELFAQTSEISFEYKLEEMHHYILRQVDTLRHVQGATVSKEAWNAVGPYLLPENHPIKPKLDRMFSEQRVILNPDSFRAAGFKRYKPGRVSRILASGHPNLQGYFIKAFPDSDTVIKFEWRKLVHRVVGSNAVRECIRKRRFGKKFKVPHKWIYPLPEHPSPPKNSNYARKNFILVAEDMRIYEHNENNKKYKNEMTKELLNCLYIILEDVGLYDSVYAFNVPFCKDGKLAFIDTEWHHRWPVPYKKFSRYFSKDMKKYWEKLIENKGPKKEKE